MKVKWLGHASFAITADDGTCIVTDPYEPGGFGGAIGYGPITEKADVVTVSHDHADHNYVAGVPGAPTVLKGAGAHEARGIDFKGLETAHDSSGGAERGSNVIFTFTMDDIVVCHLGDLGHRLTADQIDAIGEVDLLLIPVGGRWSQTLLEAYKDSGGRVGERTHGGCVFVPLIGEDGW